MKTLGFNGGTLKNDILTDGPYIETMECASGNYFLFVNSLDEAKKLGVGYMI